MQHRLAVRVEASPPTSMPSRNGKRSEQKSRKHMICMQVTNVQLFNHRHENVNDVNETRSSQSVSQSVMHALPSIKVLEVGRYQQPTNQPTQTPNPQFLFFVLFSHPSQTLPRADFTHNSNHPRRHPPAVSFRRCAYQSIKTNSHHAIRKEEREPTCHVCR